jgi:hypothetical protein
VQAPDVVDPTSFGRAWAARVLRPGPLTAGDREQVAAAIRRCYLVAGLRPPGGVVWVLSPEQAERSRSTDEQLLEAVRSQWGPVRRRWDPMRYLGPVPLLLLWAWVGVWLGLVVMLLAAVLYRTAAVWSLELLLLGGYLWGVRVLLSPRRARWAGGGPSKTGGLAITVAVVIGLLALLWLGTLPVRLWPGRWMLPVPHPMRAVLDPLVVLLVLAAAVAGAGHGWRRGRRWVERREARALASIAGTIRSRAVRVLTRTVTVRDGVDDRWEAGAAVAEADLLAAAMPRPVAPRVLAGWAYRAGSPRRSRRLRVARAVLDAHERAARVSWQPFRRVVLALEPPVEVHSAPSGLHRLDGPAVVWADGSALFYLNGVRVPRRPDVTDWTAQEIHEVANSETRRVMIEAIGWERYIRSAQLAIVASVPDPANLPHRLALYETADGIDDGCRLLVMTNGSPDRTGAVRRYAEYVPEHFEDPVEAAAWQYGVPVELYRQLQRRT